MTVPARQTAREALAALMTSGMTTLNGIYDYLPKDFAGKSPVASVESWSWEPQWTPALDNMVGLRVIISVRRDENAASAEDMLDSQCKAFIEIIEAWDNAVFVSPSTVEYEMIDSIQYKSEAFVVMVDWQG